MTTFADMRSSHGNEIRVGPFTAPSGAEWAVVRLSDGTRTVASMHTFKYVIRLTPKDGGS